MSAWFTCYRCGCTLLTAEHGHSPLSRLWFAVAPGKSLVSGPIFTTHVDAVTYATERARAERLAAVQSAEGVTGR